MSNNSWADYSTNPALNTDIAGTNIAVGCPPSNVGVYMRTALAQNAAFRDNATFTAATITTATLGNPSTVKDVAGNNQLIGYRRIPQVIVSTPTTLALDHSGKSLYSSAAITVPTNATVAFTVGDAVEVVNSANATLSIVQASGVTLRQAGTTNTGTRTLAPYAQGVIQKLETDVWSIGGAGVS